MGKLGLTITKAELKDILGCTSWKRFYRVFLTDAVITNVLGLSKAQYKQIREFDVEQSSKLYEYFHLKEQGHSA
jgi:hypothetical protein